ncbi:hypothetical protein V8J36_17345 [Frigidibacter sp. MR17.14]|uniref:hypothetical protein n=1 Tax=Frigidibacter sp. MR17.14 TaxID=3126509 RepID=UPI003012EC65
MTISIHGWGGPASGHIAAAETPAPLYSIQLVDRRTGRAHRVNGRTLTVFSRDPAGAVAELLEGRDRRNWTPRIEALQTRNRSR